MTQQKRYDVAIVGGGMVGNTLACLLADLGFGVVVLERKAPKAYDAADALELRVSAISLGSQNVLDAAGIWPRIERMRSAVYRRMQVWDGVSGEEVMFDATAFGHSHLGHIVENRLIQRAAFEAAQQQPNVEYVLDADVRGVDVLGGYAQVRLSDGRNIKAQLLVGADGADSTIRQSAGIQVKRHDYAMKALVANVETAYPQQDITWQRFVPTGPEAFLPLPGSHGSLVWYHSADEVDRLQELSPQALHDAFYRYFPEELGQINHVLGVGSFPLRKQLAEQYCKPRLALVGDAAHAIHPLAGQGVNLGIMDAAALAEALVAEQGKHGDAGRHSGLLRYERSRMFDNALVANLMHGFERGFSNDLRLQSWLRAVGLSAANRADWAKSKVIEAALGIAPDAPALARAVPLH